MALNCKKSKSYRWTGFGVFEFISCLLPEITMRASTNGPYIIFGTPQRNGHEFKSCFFHFYFNYVSLARVVPPANQKKNKIWYMVATEPTRNSTTMRDTTIPRPKLQEYTIRNMNILRAQFEARCCDYHPPRSQDISYCYHP